METDKNPIPVGVQRGVAESRPQRVRPHVHEFLRSLLATILIALFGTTFIVQSFQIPSQSMEPTLLVGDYLLVNKFIFGGHGAWYERVLPYRNIRRGEVIVFKYPYDDHPHYVKRVIGIPGDRIRIVDQQVYVNGWKANEPYVVHNSAYDDPFGDNFPPSNNFVLRRGLRPEWAADLMNHVVKGELVVPPGEYFVMGDNRDRSWDSRYWGFVRRDAIIGRPIVIYWSVKSTARDYEDGELQGNVHGFFTTLAHLPFRTRWARLMQEVH